MAKRTGRLRVAGFLLALAASGCALGPPATPHDPAERARIARAQAALDTMGGLSARFVQVGPGGDVAEGRAWFETGHLRLDYDAPAKRVVVAGAGRLVIRDARTESVTRIALASNPLGLLLSGPVRLSGAIDVTNVQGGPDTLQLSLARASNPAQGLLTLFFVADARGGLMLSGLEAVDAERHRTRFHLTDQATGQRFDPALFIPPGS